MLAGRGTSPDDLPGGNLRFRFLVFLVLLTVSYRVFVALSDPILNSDGYFYLRTAAGYLGEAFGEGAELHRLHPLYPGLIALFRLLLPWPVVCGVLISILASAGTVLLLWRLVARGWGARAAGFTCLLYAVHPVFAGMEAKVMTESFFHFFSLAAIVFLLEGVEDRCWRRGAAAGAAIGLAYLTRTTGVVLGGILAATCLLLMFRPAFRRAWPVFLATGAAAFLVSLPYWIHLHDVHGRWTLSGKPAVQRVEGKQDAPDLPGGNKERKNWERMGRFGGAAFNVGRQWVKAFYIVPIVLLMGGLLLAGKTAGGRGRGLFLFVFSLLFLLFLFWFHHSAVYRIGKRYVALAALALLPFAGWGLTVILARLRNRFSSGWACGVVALLVFVGMPTRYMDWRNLEAAPIREAGLWLRENGGTGAPMYVSHDAIAYYSRGVFSRRWRLDLDRRVAEGEVRFLVLEDEALREIGKGKFGDVLRADLVFPVRRFGDPGKGITVYRVEERPVQNE